MWRVLDSFRAVQSPAGNEGGGGVGRAYLDAPAAQAPTTAVAAAPPALPGTIYHVPSFMGYSVRESGGWIIIAAGNSDFASFLRSEMQNRYAAYMRIRAGENPNLAGNQKSLPPESQLPYKVVEKMKEALLPSALPPMWSGNPDLW